MGMIKACKKTCSPSKWTGSASYFCLYPGETLALDGVGLCGGRLCPHVHLLLRSWGFEWADRWNKTQSFWINMF